MDTIFGLPLHPLVVHGTVVTVPLAALAVIVTGLWRRARPRLAWPAFAISVVATGLVAAAALTGGPLARQVPSSALIAHHAQLAKLLAIWVVAMTGSIFVLAYAGWWRAGSPVAHWLRLPPRLVALVRPAWAGRLVAVQWILPVAVGLSLITGVGTLVQVVLVGHSGAAATWSTVTTAR